jgi:hypothetical protein
MEAATTFTISKQVCLYTDNRLTYVGIIPSFLANDLAAIAGKKEPFSDAEIYFEKEDQRLYCHKVLLLHGSPKLYKQLADAGQKLTESKFRYQSFLMFLSFVYPYNIEILLAL